MNAEHGEENVQVKPLTPKLLSPTGETVDPKITLIDPKIFVWPFGSFLALFQDRLNGPLHELIRSDQPGSCLRNHIFSLF